VGYILVGGPKQDGRAAVYTHDGYSVAVALDSLHFVHFHILIVATGKRRSPLEGEALIFTGIEPKGVAWWEGRPMCLGTAKEADGQNGESFDETHGRFL